MALPFSLTRLRTVEFFGVLLPGLYVIGTLCFVSMAIDTTDWYPLRSRLIGLVGSEPGWFGVTLVVLGAYIVGSAIRALPLPIAEATMGRCVRFVLGRLPRTWRILGKTRLLYAEAFPYLPLLRLVEQQMSALSYPGHVVSLARWLPTGNENDTDPHIVFDYWKSHLYMTEAAAAPRLEELEARSRYFYGMFWAALIGAVTAGIAAIVVRSIPLMVVGGLSGLFAGLLGLRLRHVRGEEVRYVFVSFLVHCTYPRSLAESSVADAKHGIESMAHE